MPRVAFVLSMLLVLAFGRVAAAQSASPVEPTIDDMVRNVALSHVMNVRDLGGLRGSHGFIPHGRFYRAATLVRAGADDRNVLRERGVTFDLDLRTELETLGSGDRLSEDSHFLYRRISLLGVGIEDWFRSGGLRGLYLHTLAGHQGAFRDVFHTMATYAGGAILYHCTSGKDRTGMVTAILLDLAGVERDEIVRDYAISAHYLGRAATASPPSAMAAFLDALHRVYGGARGFLAHAGVSPADIHALLVKLGQA